MRRRRRQIHAYQGHDTQSNLEINNVGFLCISIAASRQIKGTTQGKFRAGEGRARDGACSMDLMNDQASRCRSRSEYPRCCSCWCGTVSHSCNWPTANPSTAITGKKPFSVAVLLAGISCVHVCVCVYLEDTPLSSLPPLPHLTKLSIFW